MSKYGPRRKMRDELGMLAFVASVPVAVALVFPFDAIGFKATGGERSSATCAFTTLGESAEAKAIAAARSIWGAEKSGQAMEMFVKELPASRAIPVLDISTRAIETLRLEPISVRPSCMPKSVEAPRCGRIVRDAETEDAARAFPRAQMLDLGLAR